MQNNTAPILQTQRLILRDFCEEDWRDAHIYGSDPEVVKYLPFGPNSIEETKAFIKTHGIPYNPLHDKGYPSIGCQPCTRAIFPGEDIRAGRWWWENPDTKECGLHKK